MLRDRIWSKSAKCQDWKFEVGASTNICQYINTNIRLVKVYKILICWLVYVFDKVNSKDKERVYRLGVKHTSLIQKILNINSHDNKIVLAFRFCSSLIPINGSQERKSFILYWLTRKDFTMLISVRSGTKKRKSSM